MGVVNTTGSPGGSCGHLQLPIGIVQKIAAGLSCVAHFETELEKKGAECHKQDACLMQAEKDKCVIKCQKRNNKFCGTDMKKEV